MNNLLCTGVLSHLNNEVSIHSSGLWQSHFIRSPFDSLCDVVVNVFVSLVGQSELRLHYNPSLTFHNSKTSAPFAGHSPISNSLLPPYFLIPLIFILPRLIFPRSFLPSLSWSAYSLAHPSPKTFIPFSKFFSLCLFSTEMSNYFGFLRSLSPLYILYLCNKVHNFKSKLIKKSLNGLNVLQYFS